MSQQKLFWAFVTVVFSAAGVLAVAAWNMEPLPPLQILPESIDVGQVKPGQELKFDVQIINNTEHAFDLHDVTQGCTCRNITFSVAVLKPGETVLAKVHWVCPDEKQLQKLMENVEPKAMQLQDSIGILFQSKQFGHYVKFPVVFQPDF